MADYLEVMDMKHTHFPIAVLELPLNYISLNIRSPPCLACFLGTADH